MIRQYFALFAPLAAVAVLACPAGAGAESANGEVVSVPIAAGGVVAARVVPPGSGASAGGSGGPGGVLYRACASSPCVPALPDAIALATAPATDVSIRVLSLAAGRRVLWVHGTGYDALIAGEMRDGRPAARVLFGGRTGLVEGEPGERHGPMVQVTEPSADGTVQVLLGETHEDVSICGRPSILTPRVLDPSDLAWKNVTVQRLSAAERSKAPEITARRHDGPEPPPFARLLRASGASSAVGTPAALTDGDLESTWAEARGGDGHGEFVQMIAPEQAAIGGLSIVVRPPKREIPKGMSPRRIWIATERDLLAISLPEDAWSHPGASYDVAFPAPLKTRCLALVLDEAYTRGTGKDGEVTIAEVTAHTELDAVTNVDGLVGALAGGGDRARMAAQILARGGDSAFAATAKGYAGLDEAGRLLALDVLDNASCDKSAPVYVSAMTSAVEGEAHHARDRLLRCGKEAAPALTAALAHGSPAEQRLAAEQLALTSPALAIGAIIDALGNAPAKLKPDLRGALATAVQSDRAADALSRKLSDTALAPDAMLDLLRSLSGKSSVRPEEGDAFGRLLGRAGDFRTKYLLLAPAARLGTFGDVRADAFVRRTLRLDPDPHLRARAAEVARGLPTASADLVVALGDPDPRVRDAAIVALTRPASGAAERASAGGSVLAGGAAGALEGAVPRSPPNGAVSGFAARLSDDPWTFVRTHAADALAASPASPEADAALARALEHDARPEVRARAVEALGVHHAVAFADPVRERLEDAEEDGDVRARAARALGRMCDTQSIDLLTDLARAGANPMGGTTAQFIAVGAIAALGRLQPADLGKRLAPLLAAETPRLPREAAKAALSPHAEVCPRVAVK